MLRLFLSAPYRATFSISLRAISTKTKRNRHLKLYRQDKYSEQSFNKSEILSLFRTEDSQVKKKKELIQKIFYPAVDAIKKAQESSPKVERNPQKPGKDVMSVQIKLGIDPEKSDQGVRGSCLMPAGLGKSIKLIVFTNQDMRKVAEQAGADEIGDNETLKKIMSGAPLWFEKCIATPDIMQELKPVARILGTQGMMPNKKVGTLVEPSKLKEAIEGFKAGSVEFRANKKAEIWARFGLRNFETEGLLKNFDSLVRKLWELKPDSLKGRYIEQVRVVSTHSDSFLIEVDELNPSRPDKYFFA